MCKCIYIKSYVYIYSCTYMYVFTLIPYTICIDVSNRYYSSSDPLRVNYLIYYQWEL
jgi:hypothetical protein